VKKSLCAQFTARPGHEAHVGALLEAYAERVREEPGNLTFLPYTLESEPRHFFVFEVYESEAAFQAHMAAEYGPPFNAELAQHIEDDAAELSFLRELATPFERSWSTARSPATPRPTGRPDARAASRAGAH
jgi:quinol monooxygenase YgiN